MNKKTNTLIFILAATVFNIFITVLAFVIFLVIYTGVIYPRAPESSIAWVLPVLFLVSIIVSFLVYRLVINIIMKKVNMDKYFAPIFGANRHTPKKTD